MFPGSGIKNNSERHIPRRSKYRTATSANYCRSNMRIMTFRRYIRIYTVLWKPHNAV